MNERGQAEDHAVEPRMPIRDAELRAAVVESGAYPGSQTWSALVELQRYRDADRATPTRLL